MTPFSARYTSSILKQKIRSLSDSSSPQEFLSSSSRNRIVQYIKHICSSKKYLEPFLILDNQKKGQTYLYGPNFDKLTLSLLGYTGSQFLDPQTLTWSPQYGEPDDDGYYDDIKLFDLIELLLIFSNPKQRPKIKGAFNDLFNDINLPGKVFDWMIIIQDTSNLTSLAPLAKNPTLKGKLNALTPPVKDAEVSARIAADLTQHLYSSAEGKGKTKTYSEDLIVKISEMWVQENKQEEFQQLLNEIVLKVKEMNNQISNVRHSDKHTIIFSGPTLFKTIYYLNLGLSELAIEASQDELIGISDPQMIKQNYAKRYDIDVLEVNTVSSTTDDGVIDLDDIPF